MQTKWFVVGVDERMKLLAKKLHEQGHDVYFRKSDCWDDVTYQACVDFKPDAIILPIQPLKTGLTHIEGLQSAKFIVGKLNETWKAMLQNSKQYPYLEQEHFIWQNASLTADAMFVHLMNQGITVKGKKIWVTGFGRVAKMLALLLAKLNAEVHIAVRSEEQLAEASAYRYESHKLTSELLMEGDFIVNTIPAKWFNAKYINNCTMPMFDIASAPGCLDNIMLEHYELLPSLPGKYFAKEAADLLFDSIIEISKEG